MYINDRDYLPALCLPVGGMSCRINADEASARADPNNLKQASRNRTAHRLLRAIVQFSDVFHRQKLAGWALLRIDLWHTDAPPFGQRRPGLVPVLPGQPAIGPTGQSLSQPACARSRQKGVWQERVSCHDHDNAGLLILSVLIAQFRRRPTLLLFALKLVAKTVNVHADRLTAQDLPRLGDHLHDSLDKVDEWTLPLSSWTTV